MRKSEEIFRDFRATLPSYRGVLGGILIVQDPGDQTGNETVNTN